MTARKPRAEYARRTVVIDVGTRRRPLKVKAAEMVAVNVDCPVCLCAAVSDLVLAAAPTDPGCQCRCHEAWHAFRRGA